MKMRLIRKMSAAVVLGLCLMLFSGCAYAEDYDGYHYERTDEGEEQLFTEKASGLDELYERTYQRVMDPEEAEEYEGEDFFDRLMRRFVKNYYRAYRSFVKIGFLIIPASIVLGLMMWMFSKNNKAKRKTALGIFIIGIPAAVLILIFGIGIMNGKWLF